MIKRFELKVDCNESNLKFVVDTVKNFILCSKVDTAVSNLYDIETCVTEAFENCVLHAYPNGEEGTVTIKGFIEGDEFHISIIDEGIGISDVKKALEPFYSTCDDKENHNGMGFTLIQAFCDSLDVTSKGGTVVSMVKVL